MSTAPEPLNLSYHPLNTSQPSHTYVANRDAIRLSTRRALREPQRRSMDSLQQQQSAHVELNTDSTKPIDDALDLKQALLTTTVPRLDSSAPSQSAEQNSSNVAQQNQSSGLMKTIRRVFSRSKTTNPNEKSSRLPSQSVDGFSTRRKARSDNEWDYLGQTSTAPSYKTSMDHSNHIEPAPVHSACDKEASTERPRVSIKPDSSPDNRKRLRRATSTVYRVTTLDSNQSTFHSISPTYHTPPSASPRQAILTAQNLQAPVMLAPDPLERSEPLERFERRRNLPRGVLSHSPRDSLEITRKKYGSRRSEEKREEGKIDGRGEHEHQKSSSSMSMGIGSMKSPDPVLTGTAPRRVMEAAGLSARLLDLEVRMEEVEYALKKLKSVPYDRSLREKFYIAKESTRAEPNPGPTPPLSLNRAQKAPDTPGSVYSTPQSEEDSLPSTPTGPVPDAMPYRNSMNLHDLSGQPVQDEEVLRGSLLDKGYHHTLHSVFNVVNAEHKARLALEADVRALRNAIAALRLENAGDYSSGPTLKQEHMSESREHGNLGGTVGILDGVSGGTGPEAGSSAAVPKDSQVHASHIPVGSGGRPVEYNDLWSHAAVPFNAETPPVMLTSQINTASNDPVWCGSAQLVSKFSFDDTEEDEPRPQQRFR